MMEQMPAGMFVPSFLRSSCPDLETVLHDPDGATRPDTCTSGTRALVQLFVGLWPPKTSFVLCTNHDGM